MSFLSLACNANVFLCFCHQLFDSLRIGNYQCTVMAPSVHCHWGH